MEHHNQRWTYESCEKEARKYRTKKEFRKGSPHAYAAAGYRKWLQKFDWLKSLRGFLTREHCLGLAATCRTRIEFEKTHSSAYHTAQRNGWLKDFEFPEPSCVKLWNFEMVEAEARKYRFKRDFRVGNPKAYCAAWRHRWFDRLPWLENAPVVKKVKYTRDVCFELAKTCRRSSEFERLNASAYDAARKHGWIDDYVWFANGNRSPYTVYMFMFEGTHSVYVGLSRVPQARFCRHRQDPKSAPFRHAQENGIPLPEPVVLDAGVSYGEAGRLEAEYVEKYRSEGWNILNIAKCGAISSSRGGAARKWTRGRTEAEARKYTRVGDFKTNSPSAYNSACRNNWLEGYTWLERERLSNGTWTVEAAKKAADENKDMTRSEFMHKYYQAYEVLRENGLLDAVGFRQIRHLHGFWTRERCSETALKFTRRCDFQRACPRAYVVARVNGWLDDYDWMQPVLHSWTDDECLAEMKKYTTKADFRRGNPKAYAYAQKNGLMRRYGGFEDGRALMLEKVRRNMKWTHESLEREARRYGTRGEFSRKSPSAYATALRRGYLDEWFPETFRWTKDRLVEECRKYGSLTEFKRECPRGYSAAYRHGWVNELGLERAHLPRGHWTLERALECGRENRHMTAGEFCRSHSRAYVVLRTNHAVGEVGFRNYLPQAEPQAEEPSADEPR